MGSAVVVGLASTVPVALLILLLPHVVQTLADGGSLGQAWEATTPTGEDWEMVPLFGIGALLVAAVISVVGAAVWLLVAARLPHRPWVAQLAAAAAAAAVPMLLLTLDAHWSLVLPTAVAAGLIAPVAAPRVGYDRRQREPVPGGAGQ